MRRQVAIYARVSSDQQAEAGTIESQIAALKERVSFDQFELDEASQFIDAGYSGATLVRPGLERLRDVIAAGGLDRLYVHSPDRLARKYAYQILLSEEFHRAGVEVVFLNRPLGQSPEDDLLLQVQGMVAEYERAKILERSRRGKRHAASLGSVNVLGGAPYGYRYVGRRAGLDAARYDIDLEQARVVRQVFDWVGRQRLTIGEVCRRLSRDGERTRKGKTWWDRSTIRGMLHNPAYKGSAGFGKTVVGPMRPRVRPNRHAPEQPRYAYSLYETPPEQWISIPVPALVGEDLFAAAQEQLRENQQRARQWQRGARYLLQGLLVCKQCGYGYYGKPVRLISHGKVTEYAYYRCTGNDAQRFGGQRRCYNKEVRVDVLESAVWHEVQALLEDPARLEQEYERRLQASSRAQEGQDPTQQKAQVRKLHTGIARLIDSYAEGLIEKSEFEPRIKHGKERLAKLEEQIQQLNDAAALQGQLQLVIGRLEEFANRVKAGLDRTDWSARRQVIRTLVKRVEVDENRLEVVFRVGPTSLPPGPDTGILQHWGRGEL